MRRGRTARFLSAQWGVGRDTREELLFVFKTVLRKSIHKLLSLMLPHGYRKKPVFLRTPRKRKRCACAVGRSPRAVLQSRMFSVYKPLTSLPDGFAVLQMRNVWQQLDTQSVCQQFCKSCSQKYNSSNCTGYFKCSFYCLSLGHIYLRRSAKWLKLTAMFQTNISRSITYSTNITGKTKTWLITTVKHFVVAGHVKSQFAVNLKS